MEETYNDSQQQIQKLKLQRQEREKSILNFKVGTGRSDQANYWKARMRLKTRRQDRDNSTKRAARVL
jgi:hypothetical protein